VILFSYEDFHLLLEYFVRFENKEFVLLIYKACLYGFLENTYYDKNPHTVQEPLDWEPPGNEATLQTDK
jgi:hypothetical protein